MNRPTLGLGLAAAVGLAAVSLAPPVLAGSPACDTRVNNTQAKLAQCVTLEGVRAHQAALQEIADANDGNRAAGTEGYEQSVEYVVDTLEAAGWKVSIDEFDYEYIGPAELQQLAPTQADYPTGAFSGSGSGDVTASVVAVDINLGGDRANTSGCQEADFSGFPAGSIALVQRGACNFGDKAYFAERAGAVGVIIFNQGNTPEREGLIVANASSLTDGTPVQHGIPVVGASFQQGVALAEAGSTARVSVPAPESRPQKNVIAELPGKNDDNVVMAGAHLDSVQEGPGINDNGSGSAALLEVAQNLSKVKPANTIRLAWWAAEEDGLLGSTAYVAELSEEERDRIALYLNFDMVGSPNHVFFIYDGDDSDANGAPAGPVGSAQIEKTFEAFYSQRGIPFKGTDFSGRSDYGPFIAVGIPSGGLFTGAEGLKTEAEAAIWGGTAGVAYDPCYHLACDTFDNVNLEALDVNADAIAYAVLQYAMNTSDINGVPGKGNFAPAKPANGPAMMSDSSQAGLHDHDHELEVS